MKNPARGGLPIALRPCIGLACWLCAFASGEAAENVISCVAEPPSAPPIPIQYGDIIDCAIDDQISDTDLFRFVGNTGDTIAAGVSRRSGPGTPRFFVFAPNNITIMDSVFAFEVKLPVTGMYTVQLFENGSDQLVDYELTVDRVAPGSPTARGIRYGETLSDRIDLIRDQDPFCFDPAQPGDFITFGVSRLGGVGTPRFFIYAPDGRRIVDSFFNATATLEQAGPHTVLVFENGSDQTVDYSLNLQCINGTCQSRDCGAPGATLTLVKEVVNDHGRSAQPNDFVLTVNNSPVVSGVSNTFPVNTPLVINETPLPGYSFVRITGAGCPQVLGGSLALNQGDNRTCTLTNDDTPIIGPPSTADPLTEPLDLTNPRPSGCTIFDDEITCAEIAGTPSSIEFDTNIPGDARFLQFEFSFEGADGQALGTETQDAPETSAGDAVPRVNGEDLGAVFVGNASIAALPGSSGLPGDEFRSSGQFRLPASGATTFRVTNFPSGAPGSVFRIRNPRIDRCVQRCFGRRPTICGSNGRDELRGTRGRDVIDGRGGNDRIAGIRGDDRICGGAGKDVLSGGAGRDKLDGGKGRDQCDGGSGEDSPRRCETRRRIP